MLTILIINVVGCLILFKDESQELAKDVFYENLSVIFNNPLFILGILLYILSGDKIKKLQEIVDVDNTLSADDFNSSICTSNCNCYENNI